MKNMKLKRSARNKILSGLSLDKRGSDDEPNKLVKGFKYILMFVMMGFLILGGFYMWGALNSNTGQAQIASLGEAARGLFDGTIGQVLGTLDEAQARGSGDYFSSKTNSEQTRYGVELVDLRSIAGSSIPAGQNFQVQYDMDFYNIEESIKADFFCDMYTTDLGGTGEADNIATGKVLPASSINIDEGDVVICQIDGTDTQNLDGAVNIKGYFSFDFATEKVTMPVYFVTGELADYLNDVDDDFFDYANLDVSRSDLVPLYNGEPIGVGMGVGGEGKQDQPLIVRSGDVLSFSTLGITLDNKWGGKLEGIESFTLSLPEGVELDEELSSLPSLACPFEKGGAYRGSLQYEMAEDVKAQLFDYYFSRWEGGDQDNFQTFQCWLKIQEDIFNGQEWVDKEIKVDIEYRYKSPTRSESITIIGSGEDLVLESVVDSSAENVDDLVENFQT
jgi:hypothetical protein